MTTIRVRCGDCGSVVFDAVDKHGRHDYMPVCVNRLKPGPGPCERDRHAEGMAMSTARWSESRWRSEAFDRARDASPRLGRTDIPVLPADLMAGVQRFTPFEGYLSAAMFLFSVAAADMP